LPTLWLLVQEKPELAKVAKVAKVAIGWYGKTFFFSIQVQIPLWSVSSLNNLFNSEKKRK
jgi:hypothetical protein